MRETFSSALKEAMKAGDKRRVATLRMIQAGLKDREIEARGQSRVVSDEDILVLLQKMVKSRQESLEIFDKAGRRDLAAQEREEIEIIREFLPQSLSDDEMAAAVAEAVTESSASGMKDMGKVIALLRSRFAGRMDFGKASALVKAQLGG